MPTRSHKPPTVTASEAVACVRSGDRVLIGSGCAAPQPLLEALVRRDGDLHDVELVHLLTFGIAPYVEERYRDAFRHSAFFVGRNVREAVNDGRADYTPIFLSEISNLFYSGQMPLDVALVMVSPPDRNGFCSLGIHVDIVLAGVKTARTVVALVNPQMPRTHGDSFVHTSQIDFLVEHDAPLLELEMQPIDDTSMTIARHIASLVKNESTLQLGIGNIPNAVLSLLDTHRDLGIHTEMFSDSVVDLIEKGVITNARKGLHDGKAVTSFAMGTRKLYDFLNDNPFFEFHPSEYTNSPRVIAQNRRMVSINSAIQVDLTGQVCADSIGPRFYSGIGGQVDFVRGAAMSDGGRAIIALPATAKGGTVSRIVPALDESAGVVTSRGDVQYVVTEYGVAYLHGKSIRERATALIEVAHADFRPALREAAVARRVVPAHWELPTEADRYPDTMEFQGEFGGRAVRIRPLRSADADRLMAFFYSHKPETIHGRYRFPKKSLPHEEALRLCTLDYRRRFALAAFVEKGGDEHIVGVARYVMSEQTRVAETAVVVHESFRRKGLARFLYTKLRERAQACGVREFTGEIGKDAGAAIALHRALGADVVLDGDAGVYRFIDRFEGSGNDGATDCLPE